MHGRSQRGGAGGTRRAQAKRRDRLNRRPKGAFEGTFEGTFQGTLNLNLKGLFEGISKGSNLHILIEGTWFPLQSTPKLQYSTVVTRAFWFEGTFLKGGVRQLRAR